MFFLGIINIFVFPSNRKKRKSGKTANIINSCVMKTLELEYHFALVSV